MMLYSLTKKTVCTYRYSSAQSFTNFPSLPGRNSWNWPSESLSPKRGCEATHILSGLSGLSAAGVSPLSKLENVTQAEAVGNSTVH